MTVVLAWFRPDGIERWLDKVLHFGNNASDLFADLDAQGDAMAALCDVPQAFSPDDAIGMTRFNSTFIEFVDRTFKVKGERRAGLAWAQQANPPERRGRSGGRVRLPQPPHRPSFFFTSTFFSST